MRQQGKATDRSVGAASSSPLLSTLPYPQEPSTALNPSQRHHLVFAGKDLQNVACSD
jgi:hypothetical protein